MPQFGAFPQETDEQINCSATCQKKPDGRVLLGATVEGFGLRKPVTGADYLSIRDLATFIRQNGKVNVALEHIGPIEIMCFTRHNAIVCKEARMKEDFESWELHAELIERNDYARLVACCEVEVRRNPGDLHALERLGDAYVLNGEYKKAIDAMEPCHREDPNIDAFQHIILDALFAMGKTEDEFRWSAQPEILRLGPEVADICYEYMRRKRNPRSVGELYSKLLIGAYLAFTEELLMQRLQDDPRFVVEGSGPWTADVSVVRKPNRSTNR